ncbi:MAG: helix-turn-helix domain-containing protein [Simkaniaceae bacterium]
MEEVICMSNKELSRVEVMHKLQNKTINQSQAADILGVSVRQVKRLWKDYKEKGTKGLISKKRGGKGNHQLAEGVKKKAMELIIEKYPDFGPTFAHEKLVEVHNFKISVGSIRNIMISHEIWIPKRIKKKRVFQMRQRRLREGELVQMDGSEHDWFEGRGPKCTLLVYIDDVTKHEGVLRNFLELVF